MRKKVLFPVIAAVIVAGVILVYLLVLKPRETDRPVRMAY